VVPEDIVVRHWNFAAVVALASVMAMAEPSEEAVRFEFNTLETPDHVVYGLMLRLVQDNASKLGRRYTSDWIHTELNLEWSPEAGAWVVPNRERRFQRVDTDRVMRLMLSGGTAFERMNASATRVLLCPDDEAWPQDQAVFLAFDRLDDMRLANAKQCLESTESRLDARVVPALRAWIGRQKPGVRVRYYDHEETWAGREAEFAQLHLDVCHDLVYGRLMDSSNPPSLPIMSGLAAKNYTGSWYPVRTPCPQVRRTVAPSRRSGVNSSTTNRAP
jgi:hypothetical protein